MFQPHRVRDQQKTTTNFLRAFVRQMGFIGGVTIWILALVLLASLAALGYRQGAIRVVFSFAGIVFAVLLAAPLGEHFKPLMPLVGIHNPALIWMLGPLEAFVLLLILFKIAGSIAHHKIEMHYKYHTDDLKLALWERLNRRLGLCLGVLNGAAYFVLICFLLFNFSYGTAQIAPSDTQTRPTRPRAPSPRCRKVITKRPTWPACFAKIPNWATGWRVIRHSSRCWSVTTSNNSRRTAPSPAPFKGARRWDNCSTTHRSKPFCKTTI
jgi:uncharacterized membrane protein required for colicin V production